MVGIQLTPYTPFSGRRASSPTPYFAILKMNAQCSLSKPLHHRALVLMTSPFLTYTSMDDAVRILANLGKGVLMAKAAGPTADCLSG